MTPDRFPDYVHPNGQPWLATPRSGQDDALTGAPARIGAPPALVGTGAPYRMAHPTAPVRMAHPISPEALAARRPRIRPDLLAIAVILAVVLAASLVRVS